MKNDFIKIYDAMDSEKQGVFQSHLQGLYSSRNLELSIFKEVVDAAKLPPQLKEAAFILIRKKTFLENEANLDKETTRRIQKIQLNAFDRLKRWLLEFLALEEIRQNTVEAKFIKLQSLLKLGLVDAFKQKAKELDTELGEQITSDVWQLLWQVRVAHLKFFAAPVNKMGDLEPDLRQLLQSLDDFYFSAKLLYSAELLNRTKILQDTYHIAFLEEILKSLEADNSKNPIIYTLYKPLLELVKYDSYTAYLQLKQFLQDHPKHDILERQAILQHLINFISQLITADDETLVPEIFDLHEMGINQSIFTINGYFSANLFLNIVNTACHLNKWDWATDFVAKYADKLLPNEKEVAKLIANARIAFEKGNYKEADKELSQKKSLNINFQLNIWTLRLRTYYELEKPLTILKYENENLYFYIFRNKKIGQTTQVKVLSFYKMYRSLISCRYEENLEKRKKKKKKLFKELENSPKTMFCYNWIKKKIEKLDT